MNPYKLIEKTFYTIKKAIILKLSSNIRYRVVDYKERTNTVFFQCNVTRAIFSKGLLESIYDGDVICQLKPEQACFLGMKLGYALKKNVIKIDHNTQNLASLLRNNDIPIVIDRLNNVIFLHPINKEKCTINIDHLISTRSLINLFNPFIACYLGVQASCNRKENVVKENVINLRLVKNG